VRGLCEVSWRRNYWGKQKTNKERTEKRKLLRRKQKNYREYLVADRGKLIVQILPKRPIVVANKRYHARVLRGAPYEHRETA
jgi:hypothetical protein